MSVTIALEELLLLCCRGALAAQQYVALELLRLQSVTDVADGSMVLQLGAERRARLVAELHSAVATSVKKELDYKEGAAGHDLVTTADMLTQAVLERLLHQRFPAAPFTVVGEEDAPSSEIAAEAQRCLEAYYRDDTPVPESAALSEALAAARRSDATYGVLSAQTAEELRRRLGVFIDPIDGTNCFVEGEWEVPMTLVGITLDGVPVAAVTNRVFIHPVGPSVAAARPFAGGLSYVWNVPGAASVKFIVYAGERARPPTECGTAPLAPSTTLALTHSSTTKESVLAEVLAALQPTRSVRARGAGNKLFLLIRKALATPSTAASGESDHASADAFACPGGTIKKWDTCAPHAFLRALGGEIHLAGGAALTYPTDVTGDDLFDLPLPLVATTAAAGPVIAQRLKWQHA